MKQKRVQHFIPCDCGQGGLLIQGVELDEGEGWVWFTNVHKYNDLVPTTFWQRVKFLFSILFNKHIYLEDMTLNKEGVLELERVCQDILTRWPDNSYYWETPTLDQIYQSMADEEVGRKIRWNEK